MSEREESPLIETCLVCKVAWDTALDPPSCREPDHPHSLAVLADWDVECHGRITPAGEPK